jgi:hypothetical protein
MREVIESSLLDCEIQFTCLDAPDYTTFLFPVSLSNCQVNCLIKVFTDDRIIVRINGVLMIPKNKRFMICELFTRINFNLCIGSFSLDLNDGEFIYKIGFIGEDTATGFVFVQYLKCALNMMDNYIPAIMAVIYANETALKAYNTIENEIDPSEN